MSGYVLDASALLAFLGKETGWQRVQELLLSGEAVVSAVNLSEVAAKLVDRGMASSAAEANCRSLGVEIIDVGADLGFLAASMMPSTKPLGLSLGDRLCLATAVQRGAVAVTADKDWLKLQGGPKVESIR